MKENNLLFNEVGYTVGTLLDQIDMGRLAGQIHMEIDNNA